MVDVDPSLRAQVIKQMNKLINVLQASDLTDASGGNGAKWLLVRIRTAAGTAARRF